MDEEIKVEVPAEEIAAPVQEEVVIAPEVVVEPAVEVAPEVTSEPVA